MRIVQKIDDGFQQKKNSVIALLDLSKALDMVWQQKLIITMKETVPQQFLQ